MSRFAEMTKEERKNVEKRAEQLAKRRAQLKQRQAALDPEIEQIESDIKALLDEIGEEKLITKLYSISYSWTHGEKFQQAKFKLENLGIYKKYCVANDYRSLRIK